MPPPPFFQHLFFSKYLIILLVCGDRVPVRAEVVEVVGRVALDADGARGGEGEHVQGTELMVVLWDWPTAVHL